MQEERTIVQIYLFWNNGLPLDVYQLDEDTFLSLDERVIYWRCSDGEYCVGDYKAILGCEF